MKAKRDYKKYEAALFFLVEQQPGNFSMGGELTFKSANRVLEKTARLFDKRNSASHPAVTLDLSGIARADSAGLALILEWCKQSAANGQELHFANIPQQLQAIARVAGVDAIIH